MTCVPSARCWRSRCAKTATASRPLPPAEAAKKKLDSALYDVIISEHQDAEHRRAGCAAARAQSRSRLAVVLITAVEDYEAAVQAVKRRGIPLYPQGPRPGGRSKDRVARAVEALSLAPPELCLEARRGQPQLAGDNHRHQPGDAEAERNDPHNGCFHPEHRPSSWARVHRQELVARAVHACSPRAGEAFVSIKLRTSRALLESELFGYVKGAIHRPSQNKQGLSKWRNGGALSFWMKSVR